MGLTESKVRVVSDNEFISMRKQAVVINTCIELLWKYKKILSQAGRNNLAAGEPNGWSTW